MHSEPGGVVGGSQRSSETHSEPGGVGRLTYSEPGGVVEGARRVAKHTQSRGERWRGAQEGIQMLTQSRRGVVEGYVTMTSSQ